LESILPAFASWQIAAIEIAIRPSLFQQYTTPAALLLVFYLEQTHAMDFRAPGVAPGELGCASSILDVIERQTTCPKPKI
jgi:hypothetical protein